MLRFRRYRVLLVAAVFTVLAFYRFSLSQALYQLPTPASGHFGTASGTDNLKPVADSKDGIPPIVNLDKAASKTAAPLSTSTLTLKTSTAERKAAATSAKAETGTSLPLPTLTQSSAAVLDEHQITSSALPTPSFPDRSRSTDIPGQKDNHLAEGDQAPLEGSPPLSEKPAIYWSRMPEHFPVPTESLIPLPSGKARAIPKIQHAFAPETPEAKVEREKKLAVIKEAFTHTWKNYRERAWMHDELRPVTGGHKDPFCSWSATLVDALDTLHIMGLDTEFNEAINAVAAIDFTTSPRKDVPVFETVIRYLGGLLGAYDVSGGTHKPLLSKAVELAEVLLGAFDTPNRMPITFYYWAPTFAANPHRAGTRTVLAELGSLALEFTRLAQLTKEPRYYDAVARITNELEAFQNQTLIPGLWPKFVDTSGCKKPPPPEVVDALPTGPPIGGTVGLVEKLLVASNGTEAGLPSPSQEEATKAKVQDALESLTNKPAKSLDNDHSAETAPKAAATSAPKEGGVPAPKAKRQLAEDDMTGTSGTHLDPGVQDYKPAPLINENPAPEKVDCQPQGLAAPPGSNVQQFTMGAMADSTYEYLPKQFLLLGGHVPQYRSMYEASIDAANTHLLFRPMLGDENQHVLSLGTAEAHAPGSPEHPLGHVQNRPEFAHLTCFAGGMWGMGAKLFNRPADLEIAKKLTDGCVWAYNATGTGIMPESFDVLACDSPKGGAACPWNQTRWEQALDLYRDEREARQAVVEEQEQQRAVESQHAAQMHAMTAKAQAWKTAAEKVAGAAEEEAATAPTTSADGAAAATETETGAALHQPTSGPLAKRQLGNMEQNAALAAAPDVPKAEASLAEAPAVGAAKAEATKAAPLPSGDSPVADVAPVAAPDPNLPEAQTVTTAAPEATSTSAVMDENVDDIVYDPFPSHEKFVRKRIENEGLWPGVTSITSRGYLLR